MPSYPTARQLAQTHTNAIPGQAGRPLPDQLTHHARFLRHTYQAFVREAEEEPIPASHAAEWVLDNFYVVQQAIYQIEEGLPPTYYRELPKLEHTSLAGYPRVYGVARHILARVDGSLDIEQAYHFPQRLPGSNPADHGRTVGHAHYVARCHPRKFISRSVPHTG